jgi:SpoVK/Ycf46/Vps4 family AAA+-type ATPase
MSDEKQPFWWAEQVNSLVQQSKIGRALKVLNRLLDLNVDRQYVLLYKVRLLQKLGRLKEGLAWVCLEAELNPKDPKVLALRDELMEFYPYSLFDSRRPTPDLLAAFQSVDSDWPDVAGMSEIKIQIHSDIILPIRDPERFRRLKVGLPNGVLFYGPPGCGKTFLARKIAEKIKYAFREIRMSDVGSPYIHETGSRLRRMFEEAKANAPTLIFLDEIDSLASNREGHDAAVYRVEEVNELLTLVDQCSEGGILVIGACNSIARLDSAMLRPGRFDRKIFVGPPDEAARRALFELFLNARPHASNIDVGAFAASTEGYSNADIEEVVKKAALLAANEDAPMIAKRHLEMAVKSVPSSLKSLGEERAGRRTVIGFRPSD